MSNLLFTEKYNDFSIETHADRDTGTIDYIVAYCVNDASVRKKIDIDFFAKDEDVLNAKKELIKWIDLGQRAKIKRQIVQETGCKTSVRKDI